MRGHKRMQRKNVDVSIDYSSGDLPICTWKANVVVGLKDFLLSVFDDAFLNGVK